MSKFFALIPAAGSGSRMGNERPKQYLPLSGRPMIYYAINTLCQPRNIDSVFVVLAPDDTEWLQYDWTEFSEKLVVLNCGGATRAESVLNGLITAQKKYLINPRDWILVHDAARPCLTTILLNKLIDQLTDDEIGGLLAIPVADTLKRSDSNCRITCTEPRENLWQAQTPQMFRYELLTHALRSTNGITVTDDASAIEALGFQPKLISSDANNFKVTYPHDLALAELILQTRKTL